MQDVVQQIKGHVFTCHGLGKIFLAARIPLETQVPIVVLELEDAHVLIVISAAFQLLGLLCCHELFVVVVELQNEHDDSRDHQQDCYAVGQIDEQAATHALLALLFK